MLALWKASRHTGAFFGLNFPKGLSIVTILSREGMASDVVIAL